MRRRTPAPLSAQQMIRDYLVRVSAAAQKVLPKGDRLLFVGRTRATIEAQVGPIASADADEVAGVLSALGDPEELARQERERLYLARRRGAAAQPAKLWKPDKPSKPDRASRRDTKPPRTRRTRGSGSRLIRKYGSWPGEPEAAEGAPAGGPSPGDAGPDPAGSGPAPADAPPTDGQDAGRPTGGGPPAGGYSTGGQTAGGQGAGGSVGGDRGTGGQANGSPAGGGQRASGGGPGGYGIGGQVDGSLEDGGHGAGGQALHGETGGPANGGQGARGQVVGGPGAGRQVTGGPGVVAGSWPVIGPGTSRPAGGNGSAQPGTSADAGEPEQDSATAGAAGPAGANGTQPASIVPGMEATEEDEPPGSSKLGRPEPLTEAWAFVRKQPLESASLLLLGVGGLLYPFPLWLIGAVVSVRSRRWDKRDKWLAFTGPVLFTAAALFVMSITGQGNFFVAFGHATHHFWLLLRVGSVLSAGYLVWRLRRGPRHHRVPPWLRMR